jgi:hypothetical protein
MTTRLSPVADAADAEAAMWRTPGLSATLWTNPG